VNRLAHATPYFFRFCIHLPTLYNDGRPIEGEKIDSMLETLQQRFGGYTKSLHLGNPIFEGWVRGPDDKIYHDKLFLLYIDAPDDGKAVKFFQEFKTSMEKRLEQAEIYIIYYRITKL